MSAKFIYTLSDENKDLQKQIGCMNGFFQLFDRHRRIVGQNHKRLQPGENGDHRKEPSNASGKATGRNKKKAMNENQRNSTESPRTSISTSSCSSSYSSLDHTKTSHPERSSFKETNHPKTPTCDSPIYQKNASSKFKPKTIDLRDVVKDSIYREPRGLSVRASNKVEGGGHTLKYIDSPRPMQTQGSVTHASSLNESFQVLANLRQAPWNSNEGKDGSINFAPRFSYEGRESHDTFKSTIKLKELPRLSLDSREGSMRHSNNTTKSTHLLHDLQRVNDYSTAVLDQQHEPGSCKRPSSVVAKLMGLEALPDSMVTNGNQEVGTRRIEDDPFSRSSRRIDETNQQRISGSPRNSHREAVSPSFRNAESSKKHHARSKFPIESAPWRQPDGSRDCQTSALKSRDSPTKSPNSPSVYGEIEKRLADLEFKKSGKDLRALKQILEAIQKSKDMVESRKEAQAPNLKSQTSNNNSPDESSTANPRGRRSSSLNSTTISGTSSPKSFKSPIVIMKPAKQVEKASNPTTSVTPKNSSANLCKLRRGDSGNSRKESAEMRAAGDLTPRTNRKDPYIRSLCPMDKNSGAKTVRKEAHPITRVHTVSSKMTGTATLRMQQKKLEWEKQSHAISPSSDLNKSRRQPNKQLLESGSHNRKHRPRSPNLQQSESELSDTGSCARYLIQQSDTNSLQSESNISFASQAETEVSSTDQYDKMNSPMLEKNRQREGPGAKSVEPSLIVERVAAPTEQPSPVSVLDATFYDDMPSPIKKISNAFKDDEAIDSEEVEWSPTHISHSSSSRISGLNNGFNHQKAENLKHLIQNFKLTSSDEEPNIDETESLYNIRHPDHMYILEILSASRLLNHPGSALTTMQLHQSGHLINPNLFLALERRITRIFHSPPNAKVQRKLVFDVVNETLVNKLALENSSKQWLSPYKLRDKRHQGQQLLAELCLEVDRQIANSSSCNLDDEDDSLRSILWADLMHQAENWTACHSEISELVLDVERLIFKDLISEVVNGEVLSLRGRPAGSCRQLF